MLRAVLLICLIVPLASVGQGKNEELYSEAQSVTEGGGCNRAVAAVIGGLLGAAVFDKNRIAGAAIGATAGAGVCEIILHYKSRKKRNQRETNEKYGVSSTANALTAQVKSYRTSIRPGRVVSPGGSLTVNSEVEVIGISKTTIQEQLIVYDNSGNSKASDLKDVGGAMTDPGTYWTEFKVTVPDTRNTKYKLVTTLYVDGVLISKNVSSVETM